MKSFFCRSWSPAWGALVFLLSGGGIPGAPAQQPAITEVHADGTIVWTNAITNGMAVVEERSAATTGQWTAVHAEPATAAAATALVDRTHSPAWFRVANTNAPAGPPGMVLVPTGNISGTNPVADNEAHSECHYPATYSITVDAFYMDVHEVTKARWDEVVNWGATRGYDLLTLGGRGKGPNHPVQTVTWYRAVKWCNALSEMMGVTPAYYTAAEMNTGTVYRTDLVDVEDAWIRWDTGYRLPTGDEWEYAARGGVASRRFAWGGDTISPLDANYRSYWEDGAPYYPYDGATESGYHPAYYTGDTPYTSPVGHFAPNGYGLCDMTGNVMEWCNDWHPCQTTGRILHGGSWSHYANVHRIGQTLANGPGGQNSTIGFRTVLPAGP